MTEKIPHDAAIDTALSVARALTYLGIAGTVGLLVLLLVVWRRLRRDGAVTGPADAAFAGAARRLARGVAGVGLLAALSAVVLQGAVVEGTGVGAALSPGALRDALGTRVGAWYGAEVLAFAVLLTLMPRVLSAFRGPRGGVAAGGEPGEAGGAGDGGLADGRGPSADAGRARLVTASVIVATAVLVLAPALGGHAAVSSPRGVLVPVQVAHVAAMGAWVGGLIALVLVLGPATRALPVGAARDRLSAAALSRFGPVALVAIVTLTLAGTTIAIFQLTNLYDLLDTAYGRAILIKASLLLVVVGIAALQHELLIPRLRARDTVILDGDGGDAGGSPTPAGADGDPARDVRRALYGELALLVAVLATTGALAGYRPPAPGSSPTAHTAPTPRAAPAAQAGSPVYTAAIGATSGHRSEGRA